MRFWSIFTTLFILIGCNPPYLSEEDLPAYLLLSEGTLIDGSDTFFNHIPVTWIYPYPEYYGTFGLPAKIPILKVGPQTILFAPGVEENGSQLQPAVYPFIDWDTLRTTLEPGKTIPYIPTFRYRPDSILSIPFFEGFEEVAIAFTFFGTRHDSITFLRVDSTFFSGTHSGVLQFDSTHRICELASTSAISFSNLYNPVWLEIAVKGNVFLHIGLVFESTGTTPVTAYPYITASPRREKWTKLYINLTPILNLYPKRPIKIYLYADGGGRTESLFVDHIRLITFKE